MKKSIRRLLSIGVSALLSISTFLTVIPQTETIAYGEPIEELQIEEISDEAPEGIQLEENSDAAPEDLQDEEIFEDSTESAGMDFDGVDAEPEYAEVNASYDPEMAETEGVVYEAGSPDEFTADGAGTGKSIQLGYSVIGEGANTASAATVYFGSYDDPIAWRVIGYDVNQYLQATLLSSDVIGSRVKFRDGQDAENYYYLALDPSSLFSAIADEENGILAKRFTNEEKVDDHSSVRVLRAKTLSGQVDQVAAYAGGDSDYIRGDVMNQKLWPLSTKEAKELAPDIRNIGKDYWLRSPGGESDYAAYVDGEDGSVASYGGDVRTKMYVRPAFYLGLESIVFASAAVGGKNPGTGGDGTLEKVAEYTGNAWKLTIRDTARIGDGKFTASAANGAVTTVTEGYDSWTVPVKYSGAVTGPNEHVSAILTDSNGNALYYGYIATNSESSDGTEVTIPKGLSAGTYKLKVFNEQCNGDKKTDLSSVFHDITLTVNAAAPVFSPAAGTYTGTQQVELSSITSGANIYYTTDGTDPTMGSTEYNGPISVTKTTTIKAIAGKGGMYPSDISEAIYTIKAVPPAFSLKPGTYTGTQQIELSSKTADADIYYTTDGTAPTTSSKKYTGPIPVTNTTTIKAIAVKAGMTNSDISEAKYTMVYRIEYASNGGKGTMDAQLIEKGKEIKLKQNTFTRDGYSFKEWNTEAGGTGKVYKDGVTIKPDADLTLYAQWIRIYSVTVNNDRHGKAVASPSAAPSGTKITLAATSASGYEFKNWTSSDDVIFADASSANTSFYMPAKNVTVKANFEKKAEPGPGPKPEPGPDPEPTPGPTQKDISKATISGIKDKTYTGKKITQALTVALDGKTLKADTDYTVSYKNNKNVGTAKVTITGKGDYTGSVTNNFKIKQAANKLNVKAKKDTYSASYSKNKNKTIGGTKIFEFSDKKKTKGTIKYTLSSVKKDGNKVKKGFSVSKSNGKLTIKKGVAKGSYKITVKVTAGNKNYKTVTKDVKFNLKIK